VSGQWVFKRSGEYNQVYKHHHVEHSEYLIDKLPVFLLLAVELTQITPTALDVLVCVVDVPLDAVDQQLVHPHHVHRLTVHLGYLMDRFLDLLVLSSCRLLQHLTLCWLQEMRST
jgi:hypothetical protein